MEGGSSDPLQREGGALQAPPLVFYFFLLLLFVTPVSALSSASQCRSSFPECYRRVNPRFADVLLKSTGATPITQYADEVCTQSVWTEAERCHYDTCPFKLIITHPERFSICLEEGVFEPYRIAADLRHDTAGRNNQAYDIVMVGDPSKPHTQTGCDADDFQGLQLGGKVVILLDSGCYLYTKFGNAHRAGAVAALVVGRILAHNPFHNMVYISGPSDGLGSLLTGVMQPEVGEILVDIIQENAAASSNQGKKSTSTDPPGIRGNLSLDCEAPGAVFTPADPTPTKRGLAQGNVPDVAPAPTPLTTHCFNPSVGALCSQSPNPLKRSYCTGCPYVMFVPASQVGSVQEGGGGGGGAESALSVKKLADVVSLPSGESTRVEFEGRHYHWSCLWEASVFPAGAGPALSDTMREMAQAVPYPNRIEITGSKARNTSLARVKGVDFAYIPVAPDGGCLKTAFVGLSGWVVVTSEPRGCSAFTLARRAAFAKVRALVIVTSSSLRGVVSLAAGPSDRLGIPVASISADESFGIVKMLQTIRTGNASHWFARNLTEADAPGFISRHRPNGSQQLEAYVCSGLIHIAGFQLDFPPKAQPHTTEGWTNYTREAPEEGLSWGATETVCIATIGVLLVFVVFRLWVSAQKGGLISEEDIAHIASLTALSSSGSSLEDSVGAQFSDAQPEGDPLIPAAAGGSASEQQPPTEGGSGVAFRQGSVSPPGVALGAAGGGGGSLAHNPLTAPASGRQEAGGAGDGAGREGACPEGGAAKCSGVPGGCSVEGCQVCGGSRGARAWCGGLWAGIASVGACLGRGCGRVASFVRCCCCLEERGRGRLQLSLNFASLLLFCSLLVAIVSTAFVLSAIAGGIAVNDAIRHGRAASASVHNNSKINIEILSFELRQSSIVHARAALKQIFDRSEEKAKGIATLYFDLPDDSWNAFNSVYDAFVELSDATSGDTFSPSVYGVRNFYASLLYKTDDRDDGVRFDNYSHVSVTNNGSLYDIATVRFNVATGQMETKSSVYPPLGGPLDVKHTGGVNIVESANALPRGQCSFLVETVSAHFDFYKTGPVMQVLTPIYTRQKQFLGAVHLGLSREMFNFNTGSSGGAQTDIIVWDYSTDIVLSGTYSGKVFAQFFHHAMYTDLREFYTMKNVPDTMLNALFDFFKVRSQARKEDGSGDPNEPNANADIIGTFNVRDFVQKEKDSGGLERMSQSFVVADLRVVDVEDHHVHGSGEDEDDHDRMMHEHYSRFHGSNRVFKVSEAAFNEHREDFDMADISANHYQIEVRGAGANDGTHRHRNGHSHTHDVDVDVEPLQELMPREPGQVIDRNTTEDNAPEDSADDNRTATPPPQFLLGSGGRETPAPPPARDNVHYSPELGYPVMRFTRNTTILMYLNFTTDIDMVASTRNVSEEGGGWGSSSVFFSQALPIGDGVECIATSGTNKTYCLLRGPVFKTLSFSMDFYVKIDASNNDESILFRETTEGQLEGLTVFASGEVWLRNPQFGILCLAEPDAAKKSLIRGTWVHLTIVVDKTLMRCASFANGTLLAQGDIVSASTSLINTYRYPYGIGTNFEGSLARFRMFNTSMTDREVENFYKADEFSPDAPDVSYYATISEYSRPDSGIRVYVSAVINRNEVMRQIEANNLVAQQNLDVQEDNAKRALCKKWVQAMLYVTILLLLSIAVFAFFNELLLRPFAEVAHVMILAGMMRIDDDVHRRVHDSFIKELNIMNQAMGVMIKNLQTYRPFLPDALFAKMEWVPRSPDGPERNAFKPPGMATGAAALVFTDIFSSTSIWESAPQGMRTALRLHNVIVREHVAHSKGYEVKTIGDAFMIAFDSAVDACNFALNVQLALFSAGWPDVINALPPSRRDSPAGWNGLRLRIGINFGEIDIQYNTVSNRYDYFGATVNTAARIEGVCIPGAVAVTKQVLDEVLTHAQYSGLQQGESPNLRRGASPDLACIGSPVFLKMGSVKLKGMSQCQNLYLLLPTQLSARVDGIRNAVDARRGMHAPSGWGEAPLRGSQRIALASLAMETQCIQYTASDDGTATHDTQTFGSLDDELDPVPPPSFRQQQQGDPNGVTAMRPSPLGSVRAGQRGSSHPDGLLHSGGAESICSDDVSEVSDIPQPGRRRERLGGRRLTARLDSLRPATIAKTSFSIVEPEADGALVGDAGAHPFSSNASSATLIGTSSSMNVSISLCNEAFGKVVSSAQRSGGKVVTVLSTSVVVGWNVTTPCVRHMEHGFKYNALLKSSTSLKVGAGRGGGGGRARLELGAFHTGMATGGVTHGRVGNSHHMFVTPVGTTVDVSERLCLSAALLDAFCLVAALPDALDSASSDTLKASPLTRPADTMVHWADSSTRSPPLTVYELRTLSGSDVWIGGAPSDDEWGWSAEFHAAFHRRDHKQIRKRCPLDPVALRVATMLETRTHILQKL